MFVHTGDYVEHTNAASPNSSYYTFTPRPLMGGGFYTMDDALASQLTAAHRSIGVLEGMLQSFHEKNTFTELIIYKESCYNKMIDCPELDSHSIVLSRGLDKADDEINNIAATYHGIMETSAKGINLDNIAGCAFFGNKSKQKMRVRSSQIFLTKSFSNYRQYNPTAPKNILPAMNDIIRYAMNDEVDVLVKSAMCHYQFEIVHPYERLNGVIGRLLVYDILLSLGLKGVQYLTLSHCLYNHRAEYFEKLGLTQKSGNYTAWIEFFISIICKSARDGIKSAQGYINIMRSDEEKLVCNKSNLRHLGDVYNHFKKNVVSSVSQTSSQLQITFNAASRAIETLQRLGILIQVTEQSRNRLFAHDGLLRLLLSE